MRRNENFPWATGHHMSDYIMIIFIIIIIIIIISSPVFE